MCSAAQAEPGREPEADHAARARRRRHWEMLTVCIVAILLAAVLRVRADGRVTFPGLAQHPLPPSCMTQRAFGVKCPGCGMTRSFIHLAHGDWPAAWAAHRLGWLVFAAAVLQVPYRLACLRRKALPLETSPLPKWFSWSIILLLTGNWVAEAIA